MAENGGKCDILSNFQTMCDFIEKFQWLEVGLDLNFKAYPTDEATDENWNIFQGFLN